ncbi:MAG TPA: hypothetical protein PK819_04855 [Thermomicrobiales bacterium]|nr:hypothetical protein [Thermomicrobiales bacterium]
MRIETLQGDESVRPIGAIVVTNDSPDILIDAGPADGLPVLRLRLTRSEALQLSANLRAVANGRDEELLLADS